MRILTPAMVTSILELVALDTSIRDLSVRLACAFEEMTETVKPTLTRRLREVECQRKRLSEYYAALHEDPEESWDVVQAKFIDGVRAVTVMYDSVEQELKSQMIETNFGCLG